MFFLGATQLVIDEAARRAQTLYPSSKSSAMPADISDAKAKDS